RSTGIGPPFATRARNWPTFGPSPYPRCCSGASAIPTWAFSSARGSSAGCPASGSSASPTAATGYRTTCPSASTVRCWRSWARRAERSGRPGPNHADQVAHPGWVQFLEGVANARGGQEAVGVGQVVVDVLRRDAAGDGQGMLAQGLLHDAD